MKDGEFFILTAGIPLSKEKPVSDRPEHIVLIQCSEKRLCHPDGKPFQVDIQIKIVSLIGRCPAAIFGATYRCGLNEEGSVRLSNGFITIPCELQGRRIGTWVMDEIVSWAKQWPNARVEPIRLQKAQATDDNKHRRNRFYNQFGFQFDLEAEEGGSPSCLVTAQLKTVDKPRNIIKMSIESKIVALMEECESLQIQKKNVRPVEKMTLSFLSSVKKI